MNTINSTSAEVAAMLEQINSQQLNWQPLLEILTKNSSPEELAQSLLALYFCISDAVIALPEHITTENLRNDLMQLRQLYMAISKLSEAPQEKMMLVVA